MALFGAAHFKNKWAAFLVPLLALWLSDLVVTNILYASYYKTFTLFYSGFYWVYGAIALTTALGFLLLKKVSFGTVAGSSIAASLLFFIVTNFGSWPGNSLYSQDLNGLIACYAAGIPFFGGTLAGNLFYSAYCLAALRSRSDSFDFASRCGAQRGANVNRSDVFRAWERSYAAITVNVYRDHARMSAAMSRLLCLRAGTFKGSRITQKLKRLQGR
jgi:hypothetical protein